MSPVHTNEESTFRVIYGSSPIVDVTPLLTDPNRIEQIIESTGSSIDAATWAARLDRIRIQICRVMVNHLPGTGFLVAPNLVLTNFHLVDSVIQGFVSPEAVTFIFQQMGGGELFKFRLHEDFLIAKSPTSPVDGEPPPKSREATIDELDFALLRLNGDPGADRGVIKVSAPVDFKAGSALHIVQHPDGDDVLQVAIQPNGVRRVNPNRTRVTHVTNTKGGSSGSPCFDKDWNLVAIHNAGDPRPVPEFNEGIPITTILAKLPPGTLG